MFCDTDLQLAEAALPDAPDVQNVTAVADVRNQAGPAEALEMLPLGFSALQSGESVTCNMHALVQAPVHAASALVAIGPEVPGNEIIRVRFADVTDCTDTSVVILELPPAYESKWREQDPTSVDILIAQLVARGRLVFERSANSNNISLPLFRAFVSQVPHAIFTAVKHISLDTGSGKDVNYQTLLSLCAKARTLPGLSTLDLCLYSEPSACSRFTWPELSPSLWIYEGATYDDWDAEAEVKSYLPSKQELASVFHFLEAEHGESTADHLLDVTREALRSFHWDRIKILSMQPPGLAERLLPSEKGRVRIT